MARVQVSGIVIGGWGPMSGIEIGDVLISCNRQNIETEDSLRAALASAPQGSELVVNRNGLAVYLAVGRGDPGFSTCLVNTDDEEKAESHSGNVLVTTTHCLEGYRVQKTLDVISAECVFGMNVFKDMLVAFTDLVGGRSKTAQSTLKSARQTCLHELREEAHRLGANAVVGVALSCSEISSQGKSMLFMVATGTAVVVVENIVDAHGVLCRCCNPCSDAESGG